MPPGIHSFTESFVPRRFLTPDVEPPGLCPLLEKTFEPHLTKFLGSFGMALKFNSIQ